MTGFELTAALKSEARRLGFDRVGACPASPAPRFEAFRAWLASGYAGQMHYLADQAAAREHPERVLGGVRSVLMLAVQYGGASPAPAAPGQGRISRYAWGEADYHDVIRGRLRRLADWLRRRAPQARVRGVVDTAPLLEREFGRLAGLGWIGKNTMLLDRRAGSWFFLAALLTDQPLEYDSPQEKDYCGTCRACLDTCPANAFPEPYVLDATKCISYLTIELRGAIPRRLRGAVGDWLFGCDVCQEVCPWNRRASPGTEPLFEPAPGRNPADLAELFSLNDDSFRRRFRSTALWRAGRSGVLSSAAVVLGNQRVAQAFPALAIGLEDREPLVRSACAWALGRCDDPRAEPALRRRWECESDEQVRLEIQAALRQDDDQDDDA